MRLGKPSRNGDEFTAYDPGISADSQFQSVAKRFWTGTDNMYIPYIETPQCADLRAKIAAWKARGGKPKRIKTKRFVEIPEPLMAEAINMRKSGSTIMQVYERFPQYSYNMWRVRI